MADKPRVTRAMVKAIEASMDNQLTGLWPGDPIQVLGLTQGAYIGGYGAVFMSEVNLSPGAGITPFHPALTKNDVARIRDKKLSRLPGLKQLMQQMLLNSAVLLETVPASEQITVGITLFYWHGESTDGLPSQIVMHAPRRVLASVKSGITAKTALATALTVEEF